MPALKKLDASANIKELAARRSRPTIAERRRKKVVWRAKVPVLSLGDIPPRPEDECTSTSSDELSSPASDTEQLILELQGVLEADDGPGKEVDELGFQRGCMLDAQHVVLQLLDREFPGRSNYAGHFLGQGRSIHWLLRRLAEHCLGNDQVETALRVATVVAVITDESSRDIALYKKTHPEAKTGEVDEVKYKLNHMHHQLDVSVRALDRKMAALALAAGLREPA